MLLPFLTDCGGGEGFFYCVVGVDTLGIIIPYYFGLCDCQCCCGLWCCAGLSWAQGYLFIGILIVKNITAYFQVFASGVTD